MSDVVSSVTPDGGPEIADTDIAIVGMSGRFPGAADADELWDRVERGDDCLTDLSEGDLLAAGIERNVLDDDHYVRRAGVIADVERFDPAFFGIGARDAALMDPQHRLLMECAWEALETAGQVPERFAGSIGLFAGCGANTYLLHNLLTNQQLVDELGWFLIRHTGNDKDFLSTGISYRLDLRGPSINVQTACSTSLVAVHLAVQSLLGFECDMALAGGATIEVPHGVGYRYREGEILSPSGRCRAFDEGSDGTVLTSGAGIVALRRAADALRDGDPVLALIKGSAVNNDGGRKVGYLAPSVDGHADVVREALELADVDARTITLLEAHGTGTAVGDPIEVAALTEAFRAHTVDREFCRLVSTKPNIGHLDTAAGVASLIKTVQALRHRRLPPLANHRAPSPLLGIATTPFVLSGEASPWEPDGPRRAGISSLGVGGTNAHVVVEEAPAMPASPRARDEQVLCVSARTVQAVDDTCARLAAALDTGEVALGDAALTLATGRRAMAHRRVIVATDAAHAVSQLRSPDRSRGYRGVAESTDRDVAFLFPGGGAQYAGMAAGLDDRFEVFHATIAAGTDLVRQITRVDLRPCFSADADPVFMRRADVSLPAVFLTEIALARQWMEWGIVPRALVGHSLGEYAAAHLSGVFSLEDAIRVVATRAQLMSRAGGSDTAMLSVSSSPETVAESLPASLSIAVVNTPNDCVVSGSAREIEVFAAQMTRHGIDNAVLPLALAAHSHLLDPILDDFGQFMGTVGFGEPTIPYVSNLTGTWASREDATSPEYWVRHLRGTVQFADCLATVLASRATVMTELGPGQTLSSFARRMPEPPPVAIPVLRHPKDPIDDTAHAIGAFARLWAHGVPCDPSRVIGSPARRIRLPATAFDRQRCWIEPGSSGATTGIVGTGPSGARDEGASLERVADRADWGWVTEFLDAPPATTPTQPTGPWLVIGTPTDERVCDILAALRARGETAETRPRFDPDELDAARAVCIVAPRSAGRPVEEAFDSALQALLVDSGSALRSLAAERDSGRLVVLADGALRTDAASPHPERALALGPVLAGAREYPHIETLLIDSGGMTANPDLVGEIVGGVGPVVALRGSRRLRRELRRQELEPSRTTAFREGGVYVVTGGLGQIGFAIADHLASQVGADLAVITSSPLPDPSVREAYLVEHGSGDPTVRRLRRLAQLASYGRRVHVVVADLSDPVATRDALDDVHDALGPVDGVIHAAGRLQDRLLEFVESDDHEAVVGVKARAAVVLADELERRGADRLVLVSSTSTVLAPAGQSSYVAANAVLDALAGRHGRLEVTTVGFGVWGGGGMAVDAARREVMGVGRGESLAHPVFHEWIDDEAGGLHYIGLLDATRDWVVDEHRADPGTAVLPGTGHLDLMIAALSLAGLPRAVEKVMLLVPLVVDDRSPVTIRVSIDPPTETGRRAVRVESDLGSGAGWTTHSEAESIPEPSPLEPLELASVENDIDPLARPRRHLRLGPRWDVLTAATRRNGTVVGEMQLPSALAADETRWWVHPGLADAATACAAAIDQRDQDVLFVPVSYESVVSYAPLGGPLFVSASRSSGSTADVLVADVRICDATGAVLTAIDGLQLRAVTEFDHLLQTEQIASEASSLPALLSAAIDHGIRPAEGVDVLERVLGSSAHHVLVSSLDLVEVERLDESRAAPPDDRVQPATGEQGLLATVVSAFEDLLGLTTVPPDGDFFELGGHSLIAIRLLTRLRSATGVRLPLSALFEVPTPAGLVGRLLEEDPSLADRAGEEGSPPPAGAPERTKLHPSLVAVRGQGRRPPLFVVHGAGGNVLNLWGVARHLPADRPVYGIQAAGIDGESDPDPTIEAMALRYVEAVRSVQPRGPYLLGGYSGGGVIALEMSKTLQARGDEVPLVVLLDTVPRNIDRPPALRRYRNAVAHAMRHGPRSVSPYVRYSLGLRFGLIPHDIEGLGLGFGDTSEHGVVNLAAHFENLINRHSFTTYDVDVVIARAEKVCPAWPWHYGWKKRVLGRIDTFVSPGNHFEMFTSENAPVLAEQLNPYLEAADRR
jgi:acyl transferase domain-containing protein/thioesterase domain-containing protein/nucleoside-diphosphate-sugar epimerase/acyl carrier protein